MRHLACGGDARHLHAYARGSREAPRVQRAVRVALRVRGEAHGQAAPGALREDAFCFRGTWRLVVQRVQRAFVDAHGRAALAQREEFARVDQRRRCCWVGGEAKKVGKREVSSSACVQAPRTATPLSTPARSRAANRDVRTNLIPARTVTGALVSSLASSNEHANAAPSPSNQCAYLASPTRHRSGPDAEQRPLQVLGDRARDLVGAQARTGWSPQGSAAAPGPRRNRVPRPRGGPATPKSAGARRWRAPPRAVSARGGAERRRGGVARPAMPAREAPRARRGATRGRRDAPSRS